MNTYFNCHNHTMYSNLRLLDSINRPEELVNKAIELGLSGIAITDHECLSGHMEVNQLAKKLRETNPDFTIALGNEIYLVEERDKKIKYYHFILIAKDALGHKALRELSSTAWYNSYHDSMERVPVTKEELATIVNKYKGHLIATTACMGGELSTHVVHYNNAHRVNDLTTAQHYYNLILQFLQYCIDLFDDDFYLECAPSERADQCSVNTTIGNISKAMGIPLIVGTDSHYLRPEDRFVHKAYLNSKDGEREVDDFYEFAYLMSPEECKSLLEHSFTSAEADIIMNNSIIMSKKIEWYSLERNQIIPKVKVREYVKTLSYFGVNNIWSDELTNWPNIKELLVSDNLQERYWINQCLQGLLDKDLWNSTYIDRIETEANVIKYIGEQLDDCLFAYFNTFQHYIDLFWECGSIVGPGRGSATGFLSNYLLGITQLDPIKWELPYWRFLNLERAELPDIDIDLAPSKRPAIFEAIREERGEMGLI